MKFIHFIPNFDYPKVLINKENSRFIDFTHPNENIATGIMQI